MKRLANERKYVEDMIKSKTLNVNRPGKDINSLIKYLYEQNPKITQPYIVLISNNGIFLRSLLIRSSTTLSVPK